MSLSSFMCPSVVILFSLEHSKQDVMMELQRCLRGVCLMFQGCFKEISRVFQISFRNISRVFKKVPRVFKYDGRTFPVVLRVFERSSTGGSGKFQSCFK